MRFFLLFVLITSQLLAKPVSLCVVIPSYNNEAWCIGNLDSVLQQKYPHWHAVYINDCSQDRTGAIVEEYIKQHKLEKKITLINNPVRQGALYNVYHAIQKRDPHDVILILDGDDKLATNSVFDYIAKQYEKNPNLWLTYGTYVSKPFHYRCCCRSFPRKVIRKNGFRHCPYFSGHLRTFYAGLFQQIKKEDLMEQGRFLPSAGDVATMLPMLEMASKGHFKYIRKTLYIYRVDNPLNDFHNRPEQKRCSMLVRSRPPYQPLKKAAW